METGKGDGASFERIYGLMKQGNDSVYMNKFAEAESVFRDALEESKLRAEAHPEAPNLQSWVHLSWVLVSVFRGVASLENNQLLEALRRLEEGEALIDAGPDWPGKAVMRCNYLTCQGILCFMQQNFATGGRKVLQGCKHFKAVREATQYLGPEEPLVRSFALWIAGNTNLMVSGLPPVARGIAKWLTGLSGDRAEGFGDLKALWEEDSFMAATAAATVVRHLTEKAGSHAGGAMDMELIDEIMGWADARYPGSIFFMEAKAGIEARQRRPSSAYAMIHGKLPELSEYPAIRFVACIKLAEYAMTMLDWPLAGRHLRDAIEVQKSVERRANVPGLAGDACLCDLMAGDEAGARAMMETVREYERKPKKDWPGTDVAAFGLAQEASNFAGPDLSEETERWRPKHELWNRILWVKGLARNMDQATAEKLAGEIRAYTDSAEEVGRKCYSYSLLAEALLQAGLSAQALEACGAGLALEPGAGQAARDAGCAPLLLYVSARAHLREGNLLEVRGALQRLEAHRKTYKLFGLLDAGLGEVNQALGSQLESSYKELAVDPWKRVEVAYSVPGGGEEVTWSFMVKDHNVSFSASFCPEAASDGAGSELQRVDKHEADDGPVSGSFTPDAPGILKLVFDNSYSWVKRKHVLYRVEPDSLEAVAR